jgi:hypothetical protein
MTHINKGLFNFLICLLYTGYRLYFLISVKKEGLKGSSEGGKMKNFHASKVDGNEK